MQELMLLWVGKEAAWRGHAGKLTSEDVNPGVPAVCTIGWVGRTGGKRWGG